MCRAASGPAAARSAAASAASPPSCTEFSTSDRSPSDVASVIISASRGLTCSVAVRAIGVASPSGLPSGPVAGWPRRWSSASTRMLLMTVSEARTSRIASMVSPVSE